MLMPIDTCSLGAALHIQCFELAGTAAMTGSFGSVGRCP